jgi:hypothetical protein
MSSVFRRSLLLGTVLLPVSVQAQEILSPVVVTAPLPHTSQADLVEGSSILSGDDLDRRRAATLGETLQGLPGVSSTSFGPGAGRPIIRGQGGPRVRVMENGVDTFDAGLGIEQSASGPVFSVLGIWPIGERFSLFGRVGLALMSVDADVNVSIDGETASDSAGTDRSNMVYGIGGEFSLNRNFGVRIGWDRYAEVGSDDLAGEVDIDLVSLGLRYNFD